MRLNHAQILSVSSDQSLFGDIGLRGSQRADEFNYIVAAAGDNPALKHLVDELKKHHKPKREIQARKARAAYRRLAAAMGVVV